MALTDQDRVLVDVNRAWIRMLGYRRENLIGHAMYEFVREGPLLSEDKWDEVLHRPESIGTAEMMRADGEGVQVQFAVHPEVVTGRQLVLFVALTVSRSGRHFRRQVDNGGPADELSERERDVVRLVALGASGPEIADQLHISHNTVRTHVRNAMKKVGARSRAHLVAKALGDGLVLQ